ncbi:hypothetical protein V8E54_008344 [Elaphomyces granulatus]
MPTDHPDRAAWLNNELESRYQRTGEMKDLEDALTNTRLWRAAMLVAHAVK